MATPPTAGWMDSLPTFASLKRHARTIAAVLVLTPLAAFVQGVATDDQFVSRASLLIKPGREFQAETSTGARSGSPYRLNEVLNSELEILRSRNLAGEVVDELGLALLYPKIEAETEDRELARAKCVVAFTEALDVSGIAESSVIDVAFTHASPAVAKRALDALLQRFQRRHVEIFGGTVLPFAERQLAEALAVLEAAEAERVAYTKAHGIYNLNEQRTLVLRQRDGLAASQRLLQARVARLHMEEGSTSPVIGPAESEVEASLQAELTRLKAEEQRLLTSYADGSHAVSAVREQARVHERILRDLRVGSAEELERQVQSIDGDLRGLDAELAELTEREIELRELERNVQRGEALHAAAVSALGAARLDDQLDAALITSVRTVDPPALPIEATGLGLLARVALGVFAGIVLATSTLVLLHLKDRSVYAPAAA